MKAAKLIRVIARKIVSLIRIVDREIERRFSDLARAISRRFKRIALDCWPYASKAISYINRLLPTSGLVREKFEELVFTRAWNRWYKVAYVPENRDRFFEHIVTFFYRYPIQKGDVVVEFGASSGEEAVRFARAVGSTGRLIAVEPEADNLAKLAKCLPKDRFPQVTIVPKGVWKEKTQLEFLTGGEKEHRIADLSTNELTYEWWGVTDHLREERYKASTIVQVDTVDNIVAETGIKAIDFMLFETNGAELEGILGMNATLAITKRIAARGHVMRDGVPIYKEIETYLKSKGFETAITSRGNGACPATGRAAHGAKDDERVGLIRSSVLKKPSIAIRDILEESSETSPFDELASSSGLVKYWHGGLKIDFDPYGGKASFGSRNALPVLPTKYPAAILA